MTGIWKHILVCGLVMAGVSSAASAQVILLNTVNGGGGTPFPGQVSDATGIWSATGGNATPSSFFNGQWNQATGTATSNVYGAVRVQTDTVRSGQTFQVSFTLTHSTGAGNAFASFGQAPDLTSNYQGNAGSTLYATAAAGTAGTNFSFTLTGAASGTNVITILMYLGTNNLAADFWTVSALTVAPEIDARKAAAPFALVLGALLLAYDRRRQQQVQGLTN